jgi:hypothetical protein
LSTHLRLGLPSGFFLSGFPTNILYALFSPIRATFPAHLSDPWNMWWRVIMNLELWRKLSTPSLKT